MLIKMNQELFNEKKTNLILDERFSELLSFLIARESEATTLRDIKRYFPGIDNVDRYVDDLVNANLVDRHHGRYTFAGEFISETAQSTIGQLSKDYLNTQGVLLLEDLKAELFINSTSESSLIVFYYLFREENNVSFSVYEETELAKRWLSLPTRYAEMTGRRMTFMTMARHLALYDNNMSDYFNFLTLNQINLPEDFLALRAKLGDLNPDYFLPYCERKLRRLERGKTLSAEKKDIFMEALREMNYVTVEASNYQFNMIRFPEKIDFPVLSQLVQSLQNEVKSDTEEGSFIARVSLVEWLIAQTIIEIPKKVHGVL